MLGLGNNLARGGVLSGLTNTYSLEFDGTDDFVQLGNVMNLGSTTDFTISCWCKSTEWTNEAIMEKREDVNNRWLLQTDAADKLIFYSKGGGTTGVYYTGTNALTTYENSWVHIAIVSDRSINTKGYINGVLDNTRVEADPDLDLDNTGDFMIGKTVSDGYEFGGNIDEVAIWDTALSAGSISNIYNNGVPTDLLADSNSANLQGWWRMGDGDTFPTITDNSTNSNDGTMTNMASDDIVKDTP